MAHFKPCLVQAVRKLPTVSTSSECTYGSTTASVHPWKLCNRTRLLHHRREVLPMVCKSWAAASAIPSELWRQASSVSCAFSDARLSGVNSAGLSSAEH